MNIKVLIDIDNLTAISTDPEVIIVEVLRDESGKISLEVSKPDPISETSHVFMNRE